MTDDIEIVVLSDSETVNSTPALAPATSSSLFSLFNDNSNANLPLRAPRPAECGASPPKRRKLPPKLDPATHRSLDVYSTQCTPSTALPLTSKTQLTRKSKNLTAQVKKAAADSRKEALERKRAEKKAEVDARRRERVRQKISDHASSGACRRSEVELVVSRQLLHQQQREVDVLKDVRLLFPTQISPSDETMPNLISWRRKTRTGTGEMKMLHESDMLVTLVVFSGQKYLDEYRKMHDYAKAVSMEKKGHRVIFVVWGVVQECIKRTRQLREGSGGKFVGLKELQDGYTFLYVDFGIRTHVCANVKEAAAYIVQMTDAVASVPYHRAAGFLEASLKYRDLRRTLRHRTTVLEYNSELDVQIDKNDEDIEEDEDTTSIKKQSDGESLAANDSAGVSSIRTEGSSDLGHVYLAMLCMIPGVSVAKARAIRMRYATLNLLLQAYDRCSSQERRKELLKDLRYGRNRRRIGPVLSTVVANVFSNREGQRYF